MTDTYDEWDDAERTEARAEERAARREAERQDPSVILGAAIDAVTVEPDARTQLRNAILLAEQSGEWTKARQLKNRLVLTSGAGAAEETAPTPAPRRWVTVVPD